MRSLAPQSLSSDRRKTTKTHSRPRDAGSLVNPKDGMNKSDLTFADHVRGFISRNGLIGAAKFAKTLTGNNPPFDISIILFDSVGSALENKRSPKDRWRCERPVILTPASSPRYRDNSIHTADST